MNAELWAHLTEEEQGWWADVRYDESGEWIGHTHKAAERMSVVLSRLAEERAKLAAVVKQLNRQALSWHPPDVHNVLGVECPGCECTKDSVKFVADVPVAAQEATDATDATDETDATKGLTQA